MSSKFIDAVNTVMSTKRVPLRQSHPERFEWRTMEINQLKKDDLEKMRNDPIQAFVNAAMVLDPRNLQAQGYRSRLIDASKEKIEQIRKVQEDLEIWLSELVQNALDLNAEEMGLVFDPSTGQMIWWHNGLDQHNNCFSSSDDNIGLEDLQSLIEIGSSNKSLDLQSTGKFGLGFKYWISWWDEVTVIADKQIISWKLEENGRYFTNIKNKPAASVPDTPRELDKKTIFVFEVDKKSTKPSMKWENFTHILQGLTSQFRTVKITFNINKSTAEFSHQLRDVKKVGNTSIATWENRLDGSLDQLNIPKHGLHYSRTLNSFSTEVQEAIKYRISKEVDTIKSTLLPEQTKQLDERMEKYLDGKIATLTYITDEQPGTYSPISNLFPITYLNNKWGDTRLIFDAPFRLERDRQHLWGHEMWGTESKLRSRNMNSGLFQAMLELYEVAVASSTDQNIDLAVFLSSLPKPLFELTKSHNTKFDFADANIWPIKGGEFKSLREEICIPLRTELSEFILSQSDLEDESERDTFLDQASGLVHPSEVYDYNGKNIIQSWVLNLPEIAKLKLLETHFWGVPEDINPRPDEFFSTAGFDKCKKNWHSFLPLPIFSYADGAQWLFPRGFGGGQKDHRIKMTRSIDEIREELTSDACISFLDKLEHLEGDVMVYLFEEYRDCILSHEIVGAVANRAGIKNIHGHEFLDFVLDSEREFYGGLLSEGFRCFELDENTQEQAYLIPESELIAHFENFPQEPNHWPIFAKERDSSKLVMFEKPTVQRENTYIALTHRVDKPWPTYWSLDLKESSNSKSNIWNGNGFQANNTNSSTFGKFATRRSENADLDLIYFSHWPKGLATIAEQMATTYMRKVQSWNNVHFNTYNMKKPRPQQPGQPVSFVHVELVSNTNEMRRFVDEHNAMQVPGFILPYHMSTDNSKFNSNRIETHNSYKYIEEHNKGVLTNYNQNRNDYLRVVHNRLSQSMMHYQTTSYSDRQKFIHFDKSSNSSFNSNTRTMSLTHLVLDHHLSGEARVNSGLTTKQALLFCASQQTILNGEFTNWESWIEDFGSDKKRKVIMHSLGSGNLSQARPWNDVCYDELRALSPLGFTKNIIDFAADVYAAIGNNWMLAPPHLSLNSIPRSNMEFIELDVLHESETAEDRAQRYERGLQWLFLKHPERVQSFFTDYLQSLKTLDLQDQINGLLLIATTMLHAPEDPKILIQRWITEETIPFTKEQAGEIRNLTVSDAAWTDKSLIEILDLILEKSEEHGLMLPTLDKALIDGLDINKLPFNDYYIVKNGELNSSLQVPKEISSHANPLWISKQDLQEICGINLKHETQHRLNSRFLLDDRDAILTFERARFPKIPEDANRVTFEQVHNFKKALHDCCAHLLTPERNNAISPELDGKYHFIQTWLRAKVLFDLYSQAHDSATNLEAIESDLFHQLTALKVEQLEEDTALVDGVKIGKHGYRLEWSKESGFTLQIGQHDRFIHTITCVQGDLKNKLGSLAMKLPYDELVNQVCQEAAGILTQEQVEDFLKQKPRHNLWSNPDPYKDEYASLSELLETHLERRRNLISNGWMKEGAQGASQFLKDRSKQWEEYTRYKSTVDEIQPLKRVAGDWYREQACMNLAVRPAFTSYDESESLYPNKIYRLIKPDRSTSFGHRPEHWPATPDFLGNCLFLSSQTFDRMRLNPEPFFFHADPEHLLTQLRLTFESDEFEGPENLIKVTRALQVTDESVDDANLVFDKFHLLEMLALLMGTRSLRGE